VSRRALIAANWKMYKTAAQAREFAAALARHLPLDAPCDLLVLPPYLALPALVEALRGTGVAVGAQDLSWEREGAFTGEVSGAMIADAGATHVLVGHSERRHVLGEGDDIVARKLAAALDAKLMPILCVGEKLDAREVGRAEAVVAAQLDAALSGRDAREMARVTIAYEPVWAIGTGRTATPDDAEAMHEFIRARVAERFGKDVAAALRIQYGGSVKPENAAGLLARENIDGALVGGASLDPEAFRAIAVAGGAAGRA